MKSKKLVTGKDCLLNGILRPNCQLTESRIANQLYASRKNKLLTDLEIQNIRHEILRRPEIRIHHSVGTQGSHENQENDASSESTTNNHEQQNQQQADNTDKEEHIRRNFKKNLILNVIDSDIPQNSEYGDQLTNSVLCRIHNKRIHGENI